MPKENEQPWLLIVSSKVSIVEVFSSMTVVMGMFLPVSVLVECVTLTLPLPP